MHTHQVGKEVSRRGRQTRKAHKQRKKRTKARVAAEHQRRKEEMSLVETSREKKGFFVRFFTRK